ncbi:MAG: hypothetical protein H6712_05455 [Myxococcales bacterium]|nr:hypothetical protein [Myxococcales bacterium]MCB9713280.1 hypothetical protein [Myxococcales bacterium]
MTDDLRWAARYAFLEDLWRDQARVIVDAGLEAALRRLPSRPRGEAGPSAELVDALVPRVPRARTWVAVADEAVARELAQTRPGAGFLPRASFADVVAHREWSVALVELPALHDDAPGGARLREQLAERAQEGRTVVVSAPVVPGTDDDDDPAYAALAELVEEQLGGGRIYGIYRPPMVAVVDFGGGEDEDDEDVPLSFDNTLGSQAPAFVEYVAVAGELDELPVGMTLVELPPDAGPPVAAADEGLRGQLVQAQRQAELAAIDRQALLEKVDELESAQSELEHQAAELRDHLARAVTEAEAEAAHDDRLQSSLADNQALRWKVQQLERELEEAKARPVEALEAEVAELRARLEDEAEAEADADEADDVESDADEADADDRVEAEDVDGLDEILVLDSDDEAVDDAEALAERIRMGGALRDLDRLIARVERGGIGALQLRQALVGLRKRLRG